MKVPLKKTQKIQVTDSKDIYSIMQRTLKRENKLNRGIEHFWSVGLDDDGVILYIELLGLGNSNAVPVDVQNLLRMAIYKNAKKLILVHNHPSGQLKPSEEDLQVTETVKHGGNFTGIKLIDHLIINERSYLSLKDAKLFKNK